MVPDGCWRNTPRRRCAPRRGGRSAYPVEGPPGAAPREGATGGGKLRYKRIRVVYALCTLEAFLPENQLKVCISPSMHTAFISYQVSYIRTTMETKKSAAKCVTQRKRRCCFGCGKPQHACGACCAMHYLVYRQIMCASATAQLQTWCVKRTRIPGYAMVPGMNTR